LREQLKAVEEYIKASQIYLSVDVHGAGFWLLPLLAGGGWEGVNLASAAMYI
jgi:hypothetical protein